MLMKKQTLILSYAFILAGLGVLLAVLLCDQESQIWLDDDTLLKILYAARDSLPEGITTAAVAKETGIDYRTVMVEYLADRNFMEIMEWGLHGHLIRITGEGRQVLKSYYREGKRKVNLTNQS